jgi:vesicular inhibitory amino acid transporter
VFITGTCAQLFAIGIVVYQLLTSPDPAAKTQLVVPAAPGWEGADKQLVAVMNMIFAFGGQFAFVELLASMRKPQEFSKAILVCTIIMASLYMSLGAVGYWSKGTEVAEIVIFSLGHGRLSRLAAGCILIQVGVAARSPDVNQLAESLCLYAPGHHMLTCCQVACALLSLHRHCNALLLD